MKKSKWLLRLLGLVFLVGFFFCLWQAGKILWQGKREQDAFDALSARIETVPAQTKPAETIPGVTAETVYVSPYRDLKEENPDFFGWLNIEDTTISYPVMFTPEEPDRYLHRDFQGKSAASGVPFLDSRWEEGSGIYLIYGHHMKNKTMFAPLLDYADREFWEEHPYIQFDTLEAPGTYAVVAAFYSRIYEQEEAGVFRYYDWVYLEEQKDFEDYVNQVKQAAIYDTGVDPKFGDQLLALSTCSYHVEDGRFVVVAKKIEADS